VGGFEPRVGRMAIRAVAVQGYPHGSHAGQGDILNALPVAFRWSHRVLPLGTAEAATQIRRHQLQWFKKRKGAAAWVQEMVGGKRDASPRADDELWLDQDARHLAQDASDAAGENASGAVRFCCFTQVAIVMEPDPARADLVAGEILKVLTDADGGHTLVRGKTGSGKSVLLAILAAQFGRYPGAQVFAFDVGHSLWALAHAADARHYDLAAGRVDALAFQPLARIDDPAERA